MKWHLRTWITLQLCSHKYLQDTVLFQRCSQTRFRSIVLNHSYVISKLFDTSTPYHSYFWIISSIIPKQSIVISNFQVFRKSLTVFQTLQWLKFPLQLGFVQVRSSFHTLLQVLLLIRVIWVVGGRTCIASRVGESVFLGMTHCRCKVGTAYVVFEFSKCPSNRLLTDPAHDNYTRIWLHWHACKILFRSFLEMMNDKQRSRILFVLRNQGNNWKDKSKTVYLSEYRSEECCLADVSESLVSLIESILGNLVYFFTQRFTISDLL